jgi:hypothetical protein
MLTRALIFFLNLLVLGINVIFAINVLSIINVVPIMNLSLSARRIVECISSWYGEFSFMSLSIFAELFGAQDLKVVIGPMLLWTKLSPYAFIVLLT